MKKLLTFLIVVLLLLAVKTQAQYCPLEATNTTDEWITNVTFAGINNTSASTTYSDFTTVLGSVQQGVSYPFSSTISQTGTYTETVVVWIDWNQDQTFDATERYEIGTCTSSGCVISNNIQVPVGATLGNTRMRVVLRFSNYQTDPCVSFTYGEVEDYTITVLTAPACLAPSALNVTNLAATSATLNWTSNGTETQWDVYYGTSPLTAPNGTTTPTQAGVSSNNLSISSLSATTTYAFYVRADCGGGTLSSWAGPFTFTTPCLASTIPFFEGFETGFTHNTVVGGCWSQQTITGAGVWTANNTLTDYNRTPRTGSWNAFLIYSNEDWLFYPVALTGGTAYTFEMFARQDGSTATNANITVAYGTANNGTAMTNIIVPSTGIINGQYQPIGGLFTPSVTGTYFIGIKGFINSTPWYISIDDISINIAPTCLGVNALGVLNLNANSVDLNWNELGTATTWNIEWGTQGFIQGAGTSVSATVKPHPLTGLTPATAYSFYVQSDCGGGDLSSWAGPFNFTTACAALPAFSENFDGVTTPNLPSCWAKVGTTGSVSTQTSSNFSTPNCLYMYSGSSTSVATVSMPELTNLSAGTHFLTFKARANFTTGAVLEVGYLTDPLDASTFVVLSSHTLTMTYQDFSSYPPNTIPANSKLAFRANFSPAYSLLIDNVEWKQIPSCPGLLSGSLLASNLTTTSTDLSWTELGTATSWQIQYGPTGFVPGNGTFVTTTTNPYTLSGLMPSTTYQAYIRSICAVGDTSVWTGPVSFSTACGTFSATMNQNFDGVSTPNLPLCWSKIVVATTTVARVQTITTTTPFTTPNHVEMFNSTSALATTNLLLVSPQMTDLSAGTNRLRFMVKRGSTAQDVIVGTITNPTDPATFTPIQTITPTNAYVEYIINFDTYTGTDVHFAFKHASTTASTYIYLDNISWEPIPTCLEPVYNTFAASNATLNSIDLAWTDAGTPTQWQIQYGISGFTPGTGTIIPVNSNPFTLTSLQHSTSYQAYVRVDCGNGDYSMWRGPISFSTLCGVNDLFPYVEDFSGSVFPPICWTRFSGLLAAPSTLTSVTSTWIADDFGNVTTPVNKSAKINIYGTTVNHWLVTPSFDLGTTNDKMLSFDLALTQFAQTTSPTQTGADDKFAVIISTDNGVTWTSANTLRLWDNAGSPYVYDDISLNEQVIFDLSSYTGVVKFAFYGESTVSANGDNDLFVDNVQISEIPPCTTPTALNALNITTTSAELTWTGVTYNGWEIEWDTTGFAQGTGNSVYTTAFPHGLTGLDVFTSYDFYVRAYCIFDTTVWAGPFTFTTLDSCFAPNALDADNITDNSADLSWNSAVALWQIQWDTAGFTPGTGTIVLTDDNPYALTGLMPGTVYEFYVRNACDTTNGIYSDWAGPYAFITGCGIVDAFPWSDSFENAVAPGFFPCWETMSTGGETWYVEDSNPFDGVNSVGINYDDQIIQNELLISPVFDFSFLAHPYVSFWWAMSYYWAVDPNDNYDVYLFASTDNGVTIDTLWTETDEGVFTSWTWYETMIDLTAYAGETNVQIAFGYAGFDGHDFYLDLVTVHDTTTVGVVKPIMTDLNVNIYPNPSNGMFNMTMLSEAATLDMAVMNIQGQVVYTETLNGVSYGSSKQLNLNHLAPGMYHLRIYDGTSVLNKKLIIN